MPVSNSDVIRSRLEKLLLLSLRNSSTQHAIKTLFRIGTRTGKPLYSRQVRLRGTNGWMQIGSKLLTAAIPMLLLRNPLKMRLFRIPMRPLENKPRKKFDFFSNPSPDGTSTAKTWIDAFNRQTSFRCPIARGLVYDFGSRSLSGRHS